MRCDLCGDRIKKKLCLKCWDYLKKVNPNKNPEDVAKEYLQPKGGKENESD